MKQVEKDLKAEGFNKIDSEVMVKTPNNVKIKNVSGVNPEY